MDEEPIVEETPAVEDEPLVETEPVIKDDSKPKVKDKQVVPIPLVTKTVNEPPKEKEPVVTTSTVEENEEIPFTITEHSYQGVHWGISKTKQEGKPGTKTRVYEVTYVDGKETSRVLISENVTVQPQNQIIAIGQHVEDFKNCTELRKVYPGGVYSDSPVYQKKYDRDGDGHGCE